MDLDRAINGLSHFGLDKILEESGVDRKMICPCLSLWNKDINIVGLLVRVKTKS